MKRGTEHSSESATLYHGTRSEYAAGSSINGAGEEAFATTNLDAAIWAAELAEASAPPRVYRVVASGMLDDRTKDPGYEAKGPPEMTLRTRAALRVIEEVTTWTHYHGTRAALRRGDLLEPGYAANFGPAPRTSNFVYFTRTLDAAIWGAELALGEEPERIYVVEPTGPFEDDPNLTNARFRGNPTKSFRSRAPLRVVGEVTEWQGHPPETVARMKEGLQRLAREGVAPEDD